MNDKELLMMAAKAVDLNVRFVQTGFDDNVIGLAVGDGSLMDCTLWSPLLDDGDALRLAVKLGLVIDVDYNGCVGVGSASFDEIIEPVIGDTYAATRRAIVRAAADIGAKS